MKRELTQRTRATEVQAPFCLGQSVADRDEEGTVTTHGAGIL